MGLDECTHLTKCNNYRHFHNNGTKCTSWPPSQQSAVCNNYNIIQKNKTWTRVTSVGKSLSGEQQVNCFILSRTSCTDRLFEIKAPDFQCRCDHRRRANCDFTSDRFDGMNADEADAEKALVPVIEMSREQKSISDISALLLTPGTISASHNPTLW